MSPEHTPRLREPRRRRDVLPETTVARLPGYHSVLSAMAASGLATVSSEALAQASGVSSAMLRKDLSYLGSYGTRGVGYDVEYLIYQIARALGLAQDWPVVIVGAGNLGHALAKYGGFASRGFSVVGLVDADPATVGELVGDLEVQPMAELEAMIERTRPAIAVIATPAQAAQSVADRLVAAGVRNILSFAAAPLSVPDDVEVRTVDLATELQILAFHEQRRTGRADMTEASA